MGKTAGESNDTWTDGKAYILNGPAPVKHPAG